jgi:hypothetical protein
MSLRETFERQRDRRYIMFGGKGGLGKTTFSAATAYWLARHGHKVLVFSVDPQASLSDIFQQDIFGKGAVRIMDNLYAQEIDADSHIKQYQQEIRQKILDMYGFDRVPDEIEHYIQAASAEPAMDARLQAINPLLIPLEATRGEFLNVPRPHGRFLRELVEMTHRKRGLEIGTGNKTEILLGYTTLYGDSASALNPLGDLYKTQVRQLAHAVGVPEVIVAKPPSADLWVGQTDEGELGFTYADVDRLLLFLVDNRYSPQACVDTGFDRRFVETVVERIRRSQFKRALPLIAKLSNRTVGYDFLYLRDWGT